MIEAAVARLAPGIAHHTARCRATQVIVGEQRACWTPNSAKINLTVFNTFLPPAYSVVCACMLGIAARTARQLTERNTGAEPDLNLATLDDYFIMPMPQSQLMCTTLARQVD